MPVTNTLVRSTFTLLLGGYAAACTAEAPAANLGEVSAASTLGSTITRSEALARAASWVGIVPYSQDQADAYPDGDGHNYRPDCSGFVSMAWHLPKKSDGWDRNTDDFGAYTGKSYIEYDDLEPGDAILGVAYGHIALFDRWVDAAHTQMMVYQENEPGTTANHVQRSRSSYIANGFRPIRYQLMTGGAGGGTGNAIFAIGAASDGVDLLAARSQGDRFAGFANGRHAPGFGAAGMKPLSGDFNGDGIMDIAALGAGVDGHSVDFLVALGDAAGNFGPLTVWRHADGYGWAGMKPVVGDFNGDGKWDIGAVAQGVDNASIDLLVALSTGAAFQPIANWRHAPGIGFAGVKPIAGDFNGDTKMDIGALGQGVDGTSVDLLVATSTGTSFNGISSWRHAAGYGWGSMTPVAGDFNGDNKWDFGAMANGVDGHSVDLLVATSTGAAFNSISSWRHADGYGYAGMKPVAGDFNGDGRDDFAAIGDGLQPGTVDLLVATSSGSGFSAISNWLHVPGYGWSGLTVAGY